MSTQQFTDISAWTIDFVVDMQQLLADNEGTMKRFAVKPDSKATADALCLSSLEGKLVHREPALLQPALVLLPPGARAGDSSKVCTYCKELKPLGAFSRCVRRPDGHQSSCKECNRKYYRAHRSAIKEKSRQYYARNCEHIKARQRGYWRTDKAPGRAHANLHYAIRVGKLTRESCELCGDLEVHAHHDDYSKPLDVRWLCPSCHKRVHIEVANKGARA